MASVMSLWMLRNSDSRLNLALKSFFNFSCCSAVILKWLISQCNDSNFQTNTWSVGYTEHKWRRLDNQDVEEQERSYRVTNYSAKVSNRGGKAPKLLLCNVRLYRKTGNEARRNGKRDGRGGNDGRTERNKTGNGAELAKNAVRKRATPRTGQKRCTSKARRAGERDGQDVKFGLRAHGATGKRTVRTEALSE